MSGNEIFLVILVVSLLAVNIYTATTATITINKQINEIRAHLGYIKRLKTLMKLQRVEDWQPIETAPKDGTEVLVGRVYGDLSSRCAVAYYDGEEWRDAGDIGWGSMYGDDNQPTLWMPLPNLPSRYAL